MLYQITIPGEVRVKKNSMGKKWYKNVTNSSGISVKQALDKPIMFYSKQYNAWARKAVESLVLWKSAQIMQNPKVKFPIDIPVMVWYVFFQRSSRTVDLSNLIAGVDDLLAGNSGLKLPKKFSHDSYKILKDDSGDIIKVSHSSYFIDYLNPRLDIFITNYSLNKYADAFKIIYPGMSISTGLEKKEQMSFNIMEMFK